MFAHIIKMTKSKYWYIFCWLKKEIVFACEISFPRSSFVRVSNSSRSNEKRNGRQETTTKKKCFFFYTYQKFEFWLNFSAQTPKLFIKKKMNVCRMCRIAHVHVCVWPQTHKFINTFFQLNMNEWGIIVIINEKNKF